MNHSVFVSSFVLSGSLLLAGCGVGATPPVPAKSGVIPTSDRYGTPLNTALPANFDPTKEYRWVIFDHGSDQPGAAILQGDPETQSVVEALTSAGYVVASSNYRTEDCWGNQTCVDDIRALYDAYTGNLNLDPQPFVIGASMGGMVSWNAIIHGAITPRGMVGIYPACNLLDMYNTGYFVQVLQSDYGFNGAAQLANATNGYDPVNSENLLSLTRFPILIWASYGDTTVNRKVNADLLATSVNGLGGSAKIITSIGNHGDASNYDPPAVVSFFSSIP